MACSPAGEGTTHAHADLAGALYREIDELILKVNPVTAGTGIPLFAGKAGAARRPFTLAGHVILDSGVTFLTYTAAKETQQ